MQENLTSRARIEIAHFPTDRIVATIVGSMVGSNRHALELHAEDFEVGRRIRHIRYSRRVEVLLRRIVVVSARQTVGGSELSGTNVKCEVSKGTIAHAAAECFGEDPVLGVVCSGESVRVDYAVTAEPGDGVPNWRTGPSTRE